MTLMDVTETCNVISALNGVLAIGFFAFYSVCAPWWSNKGGILTLMTSFWQALALGIAAMAAYTEGSFIIEALGNTGWGLGARVLLNLAILATLAFQWYLVLTLPHAHRRNHDS